MSLKFSFWNIHLHQVICKDKQCHRYDLNHKASNPIITIYTQVILDEPSILRLLGYTFPTTLPQ